MPRSQAKWTIMVYMTVGENVRDAARDGLLQMKEIGYTRNLNLLHNLTQTAKGCPPSVAA
jgi:hypothetical protein